MPNALFRPVLLALAMATLSAPFGTAMAADGAEENAAAATPPLPVGTTPSPPVGRTPMVPAYITATPYLAPPVGGTAVINFIAPVTPAGASRQRRPAAAARGAGGQRAARRRVCGCAAAVDARRGRPRWRHPEMDRRPIALH